MRRGRKSAATIPAATSCGYYDFLKSERESQRDPTHIAVDVE